MKWLHGTDVQIDSERMVGTGWRLMFCVYISCACSYRCMFCMHTNNSFFMLREDVCGGFFYNNNIITLGLPVIYPMSPSPWRDISNLAACAHWGYNACSFCSLAAPAIEFFTSLDTPVHV